MPIQTSIAKITRPSLADIYPRRRLFRLLDTGRKQAVTWVSGPGGSGKTTLVASWIDARKMPCLWYQLDEGDTDLATFFYYLGLAAKKAAPRYKKPLPLLTPEYLMGIPTFTRRFFEELFHRLISSHVSRRTSHGYILVLDNYQDVPEASPFHEVIKYGLSSIPHGSSVIMLSRGAPPVSLADLRAKKSMTLVGWEDLRFTIDECPGLLRQHEKKIAGEAVKNIHERTQGWAAGLVLMATSGAALTQDTSGLSQETIFNYFAGEVVNRLDSETQDFLLKSCLLPSMTTDAAGKLTKNDRAGHILSKLNRDNFFTEKHASAETAYTYHPLFRKFLLSRMNESLGKEEVIALEKQAAAILEESGRAEDAAELFIQAQDWQSLTGLVLRQAPQFMAQGRSGPIEGWISAIPDEIVGNMPWLLYWKGMCRFTMNPAESLTHLEKAFRLFKLQNDTQGVYLAWSGVVDSIQFSFEDFARLDEWIAVYDEIVGNSDPVLSPEIASWAAGSMLLALVMRQPWRTDLEEWLDKALAHPDRNRKIQAIFHYLYHVANVGGMANTQPIADYLHRLAKSRDASPFHHLQIHLIDTIYYNITGDYHSNRMKTKEGLKLADESGIHLLDFVMLGNGFVAAYNYGDYDTARKYFSQLPSEPLMLRCWDRCLYYYLHALKSFLDGNFSQALMLNEQALKMKAGDFNSPFLTGVLQAHILNELGARQKAKELLDRITEPWRKEGRSHDTFLYLLTKAYLHLDDDDQVIALDSLRKAMSIGRAEHCISTHNPWRPAAIGRLFETALEHGIEVEYVKEIIRKRNFVPTEPPLHLDNWPWPVKIFTLDGFQLLIDDKPIVFSGKVQKKPLEMLKVLISLGGSDVREDQIKDALWPEAEGDAAGTSYRTTLHRLRQLIGNENAITVQGGRVSLDARYCWVDAWAFERLLDVEAVRNEDYGELSGAAGGAGEKTAIRNSQSEIDHLERALALYRGHFLVYDEDKPWTVQMRETLKRKFVKAVDMIGGHEETQKEWKRAIAAYERGLEVDDLSEEFYQRLMLCHLKLGRKAEAVKIYKRCRQALTTVLGVGPSDETELLYKEIMR